MTIKMKTTVEKYMIPSSFDLLLMSGNVAAINEMISRKEIALADALENVDFLTERKMFEHADNEQIRINLLTKDIRKLQEALNKVIN